MDGSIVGQYRQDVDNSEYTIEYTETEANLITFRIGNDEYQAEENMTWRQFVDSEYNTDAFYIKNNSIVCEEFPDEYQYRWISGYTPDDQIIASANYVTVKGGNPA